MHTGILFGCLLSALLQGWSVDDGHQNIPEDWNKHFSLWVMVATDINAYSFCIHNSSYIYRNWLYPVAFYFPKSHFHSEEKVVTKPEMAGSRHVRTISQLIKLKRKNEVEMDRGESWVFSSYYSSPLSLLPSILIFEQNKQFWKICSIFNSNR